MNSYRSAPPRGLRGVLRVGAGVRSHAVAGRLERARHVPRRVHGRVAAAVAPAARAQARALVLCELGVCPGVLHVVEVIEEVDELHDLGAVLRGQGNRVVRHLHQLRGHLFDTELFERALAGVVVLESTGDRPQLAGVFDILGASFTGAGATGFAGDASWADFREVYVSVRSLDGKPASCEMTVRAPVAWAFGVCTAPWEPLGLVADGCLTEAGLDILPASLRVAWGDSLERR